MWIRAVILASIVIILGCDRGKKAAAPVAAQPAAASIDARAIEENNRGVGLMGQFEFEKAIMVFDGLLKQHPAWEEVRVNLAMGYLNRQQEGDSDRAMKLLGEVVVKRLDLLQARYCRALLLLNGGKPAEALADFQLVSERDPGDAHAVYYIGQCLAATQKPAEALAAYQKAITIDSSLRSAYYGAFQCLQQLGKAAEAKEKLTEFQAMKDDPRARLVEFKYTRMGKKAEVIAVDLAEKPPLAEPRGPIFAPVAALPLSNADGLKWSDGKSAKVTITAADIDADGKTDLFLTNALLVDGQLRNAVLLAREKGFEIQPNHLLAGVADVNAVLWGDFDNDGLVDVYFCRKSGGTLWKQEKGGVWKDVTEATKTAAGSAELVDGLWIDADHDGDLDLVLSRRDGPNELLNNNLNGTFRSIAKESAIEGDGRGAVQIIAADLDGDGDVDLIFLKADGPSEVFLNDRMWKYHRGDNRAKSISAAVALDSDADGKVEIYDAPKGNSVAAVDVTGTGRLDAIIGDGTGWKHGQAARATCDAWSVINLDSAKGPAVVGFMGGKGPMIWDAGSGRWPFLGLKLSGRMNVGEQMRSNASGIGVGVAARFDSKWTSGGTFRNSSGPGQSSMPISVGLDGARKADFVRIYWPDGLIQTELGLEAGKVHSITETQRQTSSCPVIFVWNGQNFAFVTDCLGVGGLGFAVAKDEYAPLRPWENVLLPEGLLQPRGGKYIVKLSEPMEEATYLDSAALVRYDLPAGWRMTIDERMGVNDPQPTGEPRFYRRWIAPVTAKDDRGRDVTDLLRQRDGKVVEGFDLDGRFVGFARDHFVELEFDQDIYGDAMIIADGWIEYPYSQTMFAAWQAGVPYKAVSVEAMTPGGKWAVLLDQIGYPAGMSRQMVIPLAKDKLPKNCRKLRLTTNQEIYWDRIFVAFPEPCPQARPAEMPLAAAKLTATGFAQRKTGRRPDYDYSKRFPLWDTRAQEGFYTRFGDVKELLESGDDALAIFGPGEEVELEFEASPGDGIFVLELKGWCKDKDLLTKDGQTIDPLPTHNGPNPKRQALHQKYNTRYLSGG
jgi:tetratricopeptide (TPR) repeat protein